MVINVDRKEFVESLDLEEEIEIEKNYISFKRKNKKYLTATEIEVILEYVKFNNVEFIGINMEENYILFRKL